MRLCVCVCERERERVVAVVVLGVGFFLQYLGVPTNTSSHAVCIHGIFLSLGGELDGVTGL